MVALPAYEAQQICRDGRCSRRPSGGERLNVILARGPGGFSAALLLPLQYGCNDSSTPFRTSCAFNPTGTAHVQDILLNRRELITSIAAAAALTALPGAPGAASAVTALDFLVVGDWGRNGTNHQRDVAAQMGEAGARLGSRTVFSVGDNFYEDGVQSVTDPQWRTSFEDIYTA